MTLNIPPAEANSTAAQFLQKVLGKSTLSIVSGRTDFEAVKNDLKNQIKKLKEDGHGVNQEILDSKKAEIECEIAMIKASCGDKEKKDDPFFNTDQGYRYKVLNTRLGSIKELSQKNNPTKYRY